MLVEGAAAYNLLVDYVPAQQPQPEQAASFASVLNQRRKLLILAAILLASFGYFAYTAFQSATQFYVTVDELVAAAPSYVNEPLQLKGRLVEGSFARDADVATLAHFRLQENGEEVAATFDGVLPDLFFNPHSEIVLGGTYRSNGVFVGDRVLIKCPSKYVSLDVELPPEYRQAPSL